MAKIQIPDSIKMSFKKEADKIIDIILKPKYVEPLPPADFEFNYIADIYSKWYRPYLRHSLQLSVR